MKIKGKLILLVVSGVLPLGIASMVISINSLKKQGREDINTSRSLLMEDRKEKLKNLVSIVYCVMEEALRGMHGDETENMANAKRLIREIAANSEKARVLANKAASSAQIASERVDKLGMDANEISEVTGWLQKS